MKKLAIFAESGLQLECLLEALEESSLSAFEFALLSHDGKAVESVLYAGKPLVFEDISAFDFDEVVLLLNLQSSMVVEAYRDTLAELNCPVLGVNGDLAALTPVRFAGDVSDGILAIPQALVQAVQQVLGVAAVEMIDVCAFYPAALYGEEGIKELASQTAKLLNAQALENKVFPKQLPFNYFPLSMVQAGNELEQALMSDFGHVFEDADCYVSTLQMPVFHGVGAKVSVLMAEPVNLQQLKDYWQAEEAIEYQESTQNLANSDMVQLENKLLLGNVRIAEQDEYRLDLWLGFDESKYLASRGLISAAEILLKHHL